jgi:hypothetical protein
VLPSFSVDCADWIGDVPANKWTKGKAIVRKRVLEPIKVDCSDWLMFPATSLALSCEVAPSDDSIANGLALLKLIEAVNCFDRQLGGAGLKLESSSRDNGNLTLLLAAVNPNGAAERVRKIVDAVNLTSEIQKPAEVTRLHAKSA